MCIHISKVVQGSAQLKASIYLSASRSDVRDLCSLGRASRRNNNVAAYEGLHLKHKIAEMWGCRGAGTAGEDPTGQQKLQKAARCHSTEPGEESIHLHFSLHSLCSQQMSRVRLRALLLWECFVVVVGFVWFFFLSFCFAVCSGKAAQLHRKGRSDPETLPCSPHSVHGAALCLCLGFPSLVGKPLKCPDLQKAAPG